MCLSPCKDELMYYYPFEKACYSTCQSPYTYYQVEKLRVCKFSVDIDLETVNQLKDASESIASQGNVASGGMKAAGALNSNSPSSALLAGLSSMLQYIRYMQIQYPPKVETMFLISADEPLSISFDFDIPPSIDEKLADYPLPMAFDKYDIDSNFVRNLWDLIGSFLLSIFAIFGLMIVVKLFKKLPKIQLILKKFLKVAKWNIPAMMLCSSSGDIFFYAGLHVNVMRLNDFYSVACFLIVLFMVVTTIWLWYLTLKIVRDYKRSKDSANTDEDWKDKWDDYQLLFDNSEDKSVLTIAYMTFFILRGFIFNLTIACLYEYPLVQVGIINGSNFLMFGYLLVYRPLKEFLALVQMFVNETLIIILSVSTLILAVMDRMGIKGTATRYTVGEAILFVIKIFNTIGLVFMGIQALFTLVFAFKAFRYFRAKGIKNPIKMIQVVAFEEFEEPPKPADDEDLKKGEKKIKIKRPPRKNIELALRSESINIMTEAAFAPSITIYETNPHTLENYNHGEVKNNPTELDENSSDTGTNELTINSPPIQKSPQASSLDTSNVENEASQVFMLDQSAELLPYNNQYHQREIDPNFLSPFPIENPRNRGLRRLRFRSRESSRSRLEQEDKASSVSNEDNKASDVEDEQNGLNMATETNLVMDSEANRRGGNIGDVGDIVESLRKMKERRNKMKRKESTEDANKSWFSGLRKLKQYLKNNKKDEE